MTREEEENAWRRTLVSSIHRLWNITGSFSKWPCTWNYGTLSRMYRIHFRAVLSRVIEALVAKCINMTNACICIALVPALPTWSAGLGGGLWSLPGYGALSGAAKLPGHRFSNSFQMSSCICLPRLTSSCTQQSSGRDVWELIPLLPSRDRTTLTVALKPSAVCATCISFSPLISAESPLWHETHIQDKKSHVSVTPET